MKDYSIIDFDNVEVEFGEGTKLNGIYQKISAVKGNVLKLLNLRLNYRYTPLNGYAVLLEVSRNDMKTEVEHMDYELYIGEIKLTIQDDDTILYNQFLPDMTNYLKFTNEAMTTLYQNPDKTYKLVPVVTDSDGILITVEEVTDETNEGGN